MALRVSGLESGAEPCGRAPTAVPRGGARAALARLRGLAVAAIFALVACGGREAPQLARVRLRTFPTGARVWIDDALKVEATPATLILPPGRYRLRMQLAGAEPLERALELDAGEVRELNVDLPKPRDATVTVLSDVVDAKVVINGYTRGVTPLWRAIVKPGPIDLTVTDPAGRAKAFRAELAVGEDARVVLAFDPIACAPPPPEPERRPMSEPPPTGLLTLGLEPEGEVFDDEGRRLGRTPLERLRLPAGTHRLELRSGKLGKDVTVEVEADRTAIYRFRLRPEDERP